MACLFFFRIRLRLVTRRPGMVTNNRNSGCGVDGLLPVEDHTDVGCQTLSWILYSYCVQWYKKLY